MEVKTRTIMDVAGEMYNNMEYAKRTDGEMYIKCIEDVGWQSDIIREAHGGRMLNDDMHNRIYNILDVLMGCVPNEDIEEAIYGIEPDVYTSDLTRWLYDHNENVYYLTEAMTEGCCDDGLALLQWAQCIYIREIGQALISGIEEYIESGE